MRLWVVMLAVLATGCVDGTLDKPQPPEVTATVGDFRNPPGQLTSSVADEAVDVLVATWGPVCGWDSNETGPLCDSPESCAIVRCDLIQLVDDLVGIAIYFSDKGSEDDLPEGVEPPPSAAPAKTKVKRSEGFGSFSKTCPGYGSGDRTNPENGTLSVNAGFTNGGLDRTVWGSFDRCQYTTSPLGGITIDGNVVVDVEDSAPGGGAEQQMIIVLDAVYEGFGAEPQHAIGALRRNYEDESIEVLLPSNGGGILYYITPEGMGFRTFDSLYECRFNEKVCTTESGEELRW